MRDSKGNQTQRTAEVGDLVEVSHGNCCGTAAIVVARCAATFTMQCPCGDKLQVMQRDGYRFVADLSADEYYRRYESIEM